MLVEYNRVRIYQRDEQPVLSDVTFRVAENEFIYIIGRVGSGKSTLLKSIYAETDVETDEGGRAVVLGQEMTRLKRKHIPALRRQMGMVFQDFQLLYDRTVYKNLRFVLKSTGWYDKDEIEDRISEVLDDVDMANKVGKMPYELSGGEQQRIAIARAILNNPKLIIADEPTANLDPQTAESIIALLRHIAGTGTAVVMSTHNMPLLDKYPGIVYRCADGSIQEITTDYNKLSEEEI